jgi:hypothetical protein
MAQPLDVTVSDYPASVVGAYAPMTTVSFHQDNCKSLVNENYMFGYISMTLAFFVTLCLNTGLLRRVMLLRIPVSFALYPP